VKYTHLVERIFGVPLAIHEKKLQVILNVLAPRFGFSPIEIDAKTAAQFSQPSSDTSTYVTQDGICVIPIEGTLLKKASGLDAMSGCTSYESITTDFTMALNKPEVKGIMLQIDSGGGEVSGMLDLCDLIVASRGKKPIFAAADDMAASAAYAIACCADKVYVTRTGEVGSIGVVVCLTDQREADKKAGVKYEFIIGGTKKVDGNPHVGLSEDARATIQGEVDEVRDMFVSLVAKNRNKTQKAIAGTEAGTFFGANAVPLLADAVGTFQDAMTALCEECAGINTLAETKPAINKTVTAQSLKAEGNEELKHMVKNEIDAALELEAKKADDYEMKKDADTDEKKPEPDDEDEDDDEEDEDGEDDKKETKKKKSEANTDVKKILQLCKIHGSGLEAATEFITKGMTVDQVMNTLANKRSEKSNSTRVNTDIPTVATASIDALEEKATEMGAGNPKKTLEAFKKLLSKNGAYAKYQETREDALSDRKAKKAYMNQLEAKFGVRVQ
jgi:signal peptide peptidase SppA